MENIPKYIIDEFYPYKRSKIIINQQIGSILFTNFKLICEQLRVNEDELCKFLKRFLNKNACITNEGFQITNLDIRSLDNALESFIRNFVLCRSCNLPEIHNGICILCNLKQ